MSDSPELDPLGILHSTLENKYQIERFVAEGGFSLLYRARHRAWNQPVAIKFLKVVNEVPAAQREELLQSFLQEGALLRELSSRSASILQAYDLGSWTSPSGGWYPYLVLEWLEGETLDMLVERQQREGHPPWTLSASMHLLEPAARALEIVHRKGVTHRDLKPANLFLVGELSSSDVLLKVLDFGIAKVAQDVAQLSTASAKTGVGFSSFTPSYGAPEQFSRASYGATGPWTDVYAFALVIVELLTFSPALSGHEVAQLAFATTDPNRRPTPRILGAVVSDEVEQVFAQALAVNPADRFVTVGAFWNALRSATGQTPLHQDASSASGLHVRPGTPLTPPTTNTANAATLLQTAPKALTSRAPIYGGALLLGVGVLAGAFLMLRRPHPVAAPPLAVVVAPSASASAGAPPAACPNGMAKVPGGPFFMGYDGDQALPFEKPVHSVRVTPFCIDVTEVTVEAYKACSDGGQCLRAATAVSWPDITAREKKIYSPLCNGQQPGRDRHPVNCVDWDMASVYCKGRGARLPTSAEWEFAVRGSDGRIYPWGDDPPDANHLNACGAECVRWAKEHGETLPAMHNQDDGFATTAPVGSFPKGRSRYGLDDVIGNVMEWVHDWDGPYEKGETLIDPQGPAEGTQRVIRGGAWNAGSAVWVRPSFRFRFPPSAKSHAIGFRCAMSLGGLTSIRHRTVKIAETSAVDGA